MDIERLQRALISAHEAGDSEAATKLAKVLRRAQLISSNPGEYDPSSKEFVAKYGATSGMNVYDKTAAGAGKTLFDLGRGVNQVSANVADSFSPSASHLDLITGVDNSRSGKAKRAIDDSKALDAALMETKSGKAGAVLGGIGFGSPAMLIPGANTAIGATLVGAGMGALQPVGTGGSRTANTFYGGVGGLAGYGLGKGIQAVANRARAPQAFSQASQSADATVGPGMASGEASVSGSVNMAGRGGGYTFGEVGPDTSAGLSSAQRKLMIAGGDIGMKTTPGQATGSRALQQLEAKLESQPMTSGPFNAIKANNQRVLGRSVAKAIGENSDLVDDATLDSAFTRLGKVFNEAGSKVESPVSADTVVSKLADIESEFEGLLPKAIADDPLVKRLISYAERGQATGEQLANLSSKLGNVAKNQMTSSGGDRQTGMALYQVKELADDLLMSGMKPDKAAEFLKARGQYRNLMNITSRVGVVDPASGTVSGRSLANVLQKADKSGYLRGKNTSDMYTAARFSKAFAPIVGDSGTATRMPLTNPLEWAASIPLNIAAKAYASSPSVSLALKMQAANQAVSPLLRPLINGAARAASPIAPYLPAGGGLLGAYAAQ